MPIISSVGCREMSTFTAQDTLTETAFVSFSLKVKDVFAAYLAIFLNKKMGSKVLRSILNFTFSH